MGNIGEIAANVLCSSGHEGKAYAITGPEPLSGQDFARAFADVTGKPVQYVSPDGERLLGRPLTNLRTYLDANKATFV